nr:response regulator [uncultured Dethiosulfovibrio sp.]
MIFSLGAVDDDEEILYTLDAMASSQGWSIRTTSDPHTALGWVEEGMVDILLVDYHMPVMSGLELIRRARQTSTSTVIIALTVEQDQEVARGLFIAGADDFVSKPVRLVDFSARIALHGELSRYRKSAGWESSQKGMAEPTARMVMDVLVSSPDALSASEVGQRAGIAYPTAHRYLEYLARKGQIQRERRHEDGKSGRPKTYYSPVD